MGAVKEEGREEGREEGGREGRTGGGGGAVLLCERVRATLFRNIRAIFYLH